MVALIKDMASYNHPGEASLIISDREEAKGLVYAKKIGIKTAVVEIEKISKGKEIFEETIKHHILKSKIDLICLAGFMRILSPSFVNLFENKILNIHPSILPLFKGLNTHQRALESGMAVHGATVHKVTKNLDSGEILGQTTIPILKGDTKEKLAERLLIKEHKLYPVILKRFLNGNFQPILID
jgi:phosphoribosylglycinamide formyltransferase-1